MTPAAAKITGLEATLAALLRYGTWLASIVTAWGLFLSPRIMTVGIGLFILLPIVRVIVMLVDFTRRRDYPFIGISALVLGVIVLGLVLGARG